MIREYAPAKVNLYLHVTGRRPDGYHLLDSLAAFGPAADVLEAAPADDLSLTLDGPFGESLAAEPDNLVLRAARALADAAARRPGAALRLTKNLPVASGIGGGSADAAAALRALNRLWNCRLDAARLALLAQPLGADIPVCVESRPRLMQGVGEIMRPAPHLPDVGLLLVNPRVPLATPAVFRARQGDFTPAARLPEAWPDAEAMAAHLRGLRNDLEAPARALCPLISDVISTLAALPGCLLARMSGSGATCFALFPTAETARQAAALLPAEWWSFGGGLYEGGAPSLHPPAGGV
ncbi:4-(cytidine 5'-diphospho)-2-C-methyl-D-erythritol kinase [Roseococcus sp. YIM B11640]|uniref:4-(cytidine 5'-diphospho)-2-C-methyl-D-erythritol kinase n=1 Tax=Roseococcus sp. YIM B11640 TaxID=3133973 RepID=UPI003C7AB13C